jgi:hypothetical protein
METRARFQNVMNFKPTDRLPYVEWAPWWKDATIARWYKEGLPRHLQTDTQLREYFGLDIYEQDWIRPYGPTMPKVEHGHSRVTDMDGYQQFKKLHLYPPDAFDKTRVQQWAELQKKGEIVVWITLEGFFWYPRTLLGIERHLFAFYDQPELMHAMNEDLLAYHLRVLDEFCAICRPDFMTFAEDMSYNNGPMLSKDLFDEFIAPYYRRIVPKLKEYGIIPVIDSDGDIEKLIPWFLEVGVDGFLPLERQAGFDIVKLRQLYPRTRYIGGYDKMVMSQGEAAMRREFERLRPVMQQGGFIPSCDHQTPPGVSLDDYRLYLKLMREYGGK